MKEHTTATGEKNMEDHEIEKTYSMAEFIVELRRLADALEADSNFSIELEGHEVKVPGQAIASVVYEIEEGHAELEFQLSWETGESEDIADEGDDADESDDEKSDAEEEAKDEVVA
jgi:amphi-Trp domain-containing protein